MSGCRRTLFGVEHAGRRPDWVVPTWWQVNDLACLALRAVVEQKATECAGMVAAVGWARGLIAGPITGRAEDPLSWQTVVAELWAAASAHPGWPTPPLAELCVMLRVDYLEPREVDPRFAHGVWLALRWLTGTGNQRAPLELPVRRTDGVVADADDVYAALVAAQGIVAAEDIDGLRAQAERMTDKSRRLAALVADAAQRIRS